MRYDAEAEAHRQRSIRSTEEVVRREESRKREGDLEAARKEWVREKQQLYVEAYQNQLKAIAKHSEALEKKLRDEFSETLKEVATESKRRLEEAVKRTWSEADAICDAKVQQARLEEVEKAAREAEKMSEVVAKEKRVARELSLQEKDQALEMQQERLQRERDMAMEVQRSQLTDEFEIQLEKLRTEWETKYASLQEKYDSQVQATANVEEELGIMTKQRSEWEEKYTQIKVEFSDFIDKVPGFRAEFILK